MNKKKYNRETISHINNNNMFLEKLHRLSNLNEVQ